MKNFNKTTAFLLAGMLCAAVLISQGPEAVFAAVRGLQPSVRTQTVTYAITVPSATEVTEGTNGVISAITIWDGAAATSPTDSTVAVMPYPGKVGVKLIDGGAASGALTCTSVVITGKDQYGNSISDTISTITETSQNSAKVFSEISSVASSGCAIASSGDTSDILRVAIDQVVGLPFDIRTYDNVLSICVYDSSATDTICMAKSSMSAATDVTYDAVDISGIFTAAQADFVEIRVRGAGSALY